MILWLMLACAEPPQEVVSKAPPPTAVVDPGDAVVHTVRFPSPQTQHFEVSLTVSTDGAEALELMMPVWTPGSYLVREFSQHVIGLSAASSEGPLSVSRPRKNRWRVETGGAEAIEVSYRLWAQHDNVRGNFVEERFAILNGAPTFLTPVDALDRPHAVTFEHPWARIETGLDPHPDGAANHFLAADYDELVDSPVFLGDPAVYPFEVAGAQHSLVVLEELGAWDGPRSAADVQKLVEVQTQFWGVVPYSRYVFLNALLETGGGLEHLDSTLMFTGRWRTHDEDDYLGWLGLVSHEFFHTWNIKRLRPVALGPFDYENEVHTRDLWIAEGFTSYYDDLLVRRADLMDESKYLKKLSGNIQRLQTTPGRLVHALGDTSYDAWTEFYRRDANSTNTTISYYTKGAVVAFLLDAEIRRRSGDRSSLDAVMREAYRRHAGEQGYTSEEFRALASELAGDDLSEWFAHAVDRPEELDYEPALAWFGLRFKPREAADEDEPPPTGWLGLELGGQNQVTEVRTDTPVFAAGVNVNDEVVGIDSWRVAAGQWSTHAAHYAPGDTAELLISRRGELRTLPVVFQAAPETTWSLEADPSAGPAATNRRERWLAVMN